MPQLISAEELEATINRVRRETSPVNGRLSPELCVLAEIYGNMIYARERVVDLDQLAENVRPMAVKLLGTSGTNSSNEGSGKVCPYGQNSDTCEACQ